MADKYIMLIISKVITSKGESLKIESTMELNLKTGLRVLSTIHI